MNRRGGGEGGGLLLSTQSKRSAIPSVFRGLNHLSDGDFLSGPCLAALAYACGELLHHTEQMGAGVGAVLQMKFHTGRYDPPFAGPLSPLLLSNLPTVSPDHPPGCMPSVL